MKIYLAATYSKYPMMQQVAARLRAIGIEVTSRWITGQHNNVGPYQCAKDDMEDLLQW